MAIDVATRGSLGRCLAIRVGDVLGVLKSKGVDISLSRVDIEGDFLSGPARRSQQKFLHTSSTDTRVRHPCKGIGGNTQMQRCIIVQQEYIEEDILENLRKGTCRYQNWVLGITLGTYNSYSFHHPEQLSI